MSLTHMSLTHRYHMSLKLQQLGSGTWVPSTTILSRVDNEDSRNVLGLLQPVAFGLCCFFMFSETTELYRFGWRSYFDSSWNIVDWVSYVIFQLYSLELRKTNVAADSIPDSLLWKNVGFFDESASMEHFRVTKILFSITLVVQIIKMIKFTDIMLPRTALFSTVLRAAFPNMIFFMFSFALTLVAFAMMLSVQMGNVLGEYDSFLNSFMTLFRALFGDFDVEEILENTQS